MTAERLLLLGIAALQIFVVVRLEQVRELSGSALERADAAASAAQNAEYEAALARLAARAAQRAAEDADDTCSSR